jgi:paired amphipathic helix protein Sin3a
LHTYQKEQKGIKDVMEQVSQIFTGHPDLLQVPAPVPRCCQ